jgi:hypothetical protein
MIFEYMANKKRRKLFECIVCVLIFTFTLTIGGCYTTHNIKISPESVKYKVGYEITKAIMKNGVVINLKDKGAKYVRNYMGRENVLVYSSVIIDTVRVDPIGIKKIYKTNILDLNDMISLTIEKQEVSASLTILTTIGIIVCLAALIFVIALAAKESCPFIYSFDGEKYIFDAEPYGGAVAEGLKKTDYSQLEHLKPINGKYKLLMKNEADETQYTDELKLLIIDHPQNVQVTPDKNGAMTVYSKTLFPYSVIDENGKDITQFFRNKDGVQWQTDLPLDTTLISNSLRHQIIMKFPKPKDAKRVKLLMNGGTAMWGGYMIKEMLKLRGDNVDKWYENINNNGVEMQKLYNFMEREELYALKVNVWDSIKWEPRNYYPAGGPFLDEDRIVDLNIEDIEGDTLTVMLNPPYGYWKFDFAGVIYDFSSDVDITELPLTYAKDQEGADLKTVLSKIDGTYYEMPDTSCTANIYFDVPNPPKEGFTRTLFLKTTGYYEIHLKKDQPEQKDFIEQIYNTPGLILEYTMKLYIEKIKELGMAK